MREFCYHVFNFFFKVAFCSVILNVERSVLKNFYLVELDSSVQLPFLVQKQALSRLLMNLLILSAYIVCAEENCLHHLLFCICKQLLQMLLTCFFHQQFQIISVCFLRKYELFRWYLFLFDHIYFLKDLSVHVKNHYESPLDKTLSFSGP